MMMRLVVFALASVAAACSTESPVAPPPPPPLWRTTPTVIDLHSDAGDYIGSGQSYQYTKATAAITTGVDAAHFSLHIDGDQWWYADFVLPSADTSLRPGTYTGLTRYPFNDPATGGLSWYGEGRGCNTLTGSLTIDTARYDGAALTALDMRFEQHCEGAAAALHGTIRWSANDPTQPAGPVLPIPANLWKPDFGGTPPSGNYVYLKSDAGDYIGAGQTLTYTAPPTPMVMETGTGRATISVDGGNWHGDFQAMRLLTTLQTGYYGGLERYPFHNPAKGGLSWWGEGRGCNTLTGWFAVDAVTYAADTLASLDLRFEQHCEGMTPALHGAIHWKR